MWNNSGGFGNYDQNATGGGGGFNSPGGFGTQSASQERRMNRVSKVQSHVPCTIAQIYNAKNIDDKFFTADTEITQITIVGIVRSVSVNSTRLDYVVDDMTGPSIDVKQYVDNDDAVPENERTKVIRERTYVRVCGSIRSFGGKRMMVGFKIIPIEDANELTFHLLEVIYAHASMSRSANNTGNYGGDASMHSVGGIKALSDPGMNGFTDVQRQVHSIIQNDMTDDGASIRTLQSKVKGYNLEQIRGALDYLSGEGHIYSTIDDDHFKATDA